jgi:hypothetical protein
MAESVNRAQESGSHISITVEQPPGEKPATGTADFGKLFGKMMDDPEMKKMLRGQQAMVIDMMFGDLFKELALSQEEVDAFKTLLLDKHMVAIEMGASLMKPNVDERQKKQTAEAMKQANDDTNSRIREFLGDERFAAYKDYEKTIQDRLIVRQFRESLADSDNPLDKSQGDQLIQVIKEEKENFPFTMDVQNPDGMNHGQFSAESITTYMKEKAELNKRVLERVAAILTPEQQDAFRSFLENQQKLEEIGMKMATQMFHQKEEEKE